MAEDDPLVTMADIAEMTGRAHDTVKRWRWREDYLPPPDVKIGGHVAWRRSRIEKWWAENARPRHGGGQV